jgi:hypothetical protein
MRFTLVALERSAVLKKKRGLMVVSTGKRKFDAAEAVGAMRKE